MKLFLPWIFLSLFFTINTEEVTKHYSTTRPSANQADSGNFFNQALGTWKATGTSFNMPSETEMVWEKVLGDKFYRVNYTIRMSGKDNKIQRFEGVAYYKKETETTYIASWFDNGGDLHPIKATLEPNRLTSLWGIEGKKFGKTIYAILDDGTIEVTDFIMRDNAWKQFNKTVLKRS